MDSAHLSDTFHLHSDLERPVFLLIINPAISVLNVFDMIHV
jgi:hypothetical protein